MSVCANPSIYYKQFAGEMPGKMQSVRAKMSQVSATRHMLQDKVAVVAGLLRVMETEMVDGDPHSICLEPQRQAFIVP